MKNLLTTHILLHFWLSLLPLNALIATEPVLLNCRSLTESSGVALSLNDPELIWTHNDSGGKPRLYLFDRKSGNLRGTYELSDVVNEDWEDMCSFRYGDLNFLAIADVGDNSRSRKQLEICIVKEPAALHDRSISPIVVDKIKQVTTLSLRYPDGANDCEALAFDPTNSRFVLLTKDFFSCKMYSVPVDQHLFTSFGHNKATVDAKHLQNLSISLVTGADICLETRQLVLCTYGSGYLIKPSRDEPYLWNRNSLIKIELPKRRQGEAIAFVNPTQIITTSEFSPTPLWTTILPKSEPSP